MKLKEKLNQAAGFTLVELIVVIAILAILAGVAVPAYSGYITQANKSNDETLASEIKNALMLGYYNGTLKPGASVIVYLDGTVKVDPNGEDFGADQAMKDAFGDNYKDTLKLSYDGWALNTVSPEMWQMVNVSNFKPENLDVILSQVGTVVDAACGYLEGREDYIASEEMEKYLSSADITLSGAITAEQAVAIANASVFCVANDIAKTDTSADADLSAIFEAWSKSDFQNVNEWDSLSRSAAEYASVLALATYVDTNAGTNYCDMLGGDKATIKNNQAATLSAIKGSTDPAVQTALTNYTTGTSSSGAPAYVEDALAFIAYMQGVDQSANTIVSENGLTKDNYFTDGNILNYVTDYVSLGDIVTAAGVNEDAFIFLFNGETVTCNPLDWTEQ